MTTKCNLDKAFLRLINEAWCRRLIIYSLIWIGRWAKYVHMDVCLESGEREYWERPKIDQFSLYLEKERIEESFCYYVGNCNSIFCVWEMQQLFLRKAFNDHKIPGSWTKRLSGVILVVVLLWRLFQNFICSFHVEISWKSFSIIVVLLEFMISINLLSNKSTTISTIKALFA